VVPPTLPPCQACPLYHCPSAGLQNRLVGPDPSPGPVGGRPRHRQLQSFLKPPRPLCRASGLSQADSRVDGGNASERRGTGGRQPRCVTAGCGRHGISRPTTAGVWNGLVGMAPGVGRNGCLSAFSFAAYRDRTLCCVPSGDNGHAQVRRSSEFVITAEGGPSNHTATMQVGRGRRPPFSSPCHSRLAARCNPWGGFVAVNANRPEFGNRAGFCC
jgi:hypothetical protein